MNTNREDYLVRAASHDGLVRAFAVDATGVVADLQRIHQTEPAITAALGRLAAGSLIFGAMQKQPEHAVTVRIKADGPAGTLLATANGAGEVRGLVSNPQTGIVQVNERGKLNVSGVVGTTGRVTVTRDLGMRQPYVGVVELVSGEIGEDLAHYLLSSEQTPSAVGLGVFVDRSGGVVAAGGFIVQLMPGVTSRTATEIERVIGDLPHPTTMLRDGDTPEAVLGRIFGADVDVLERVPVRYHCPCSRERVERALLLLGETELKELLETDRSNGFSEITCEFCTMRYELSNPELEQLIRTAAGERVA